MIKDESATIKFNDEKSLNEALSYLSSRAFRKIIRGEDGTGIYLIVSKASAVKLDKIFNFNAV